MKNFIEVESDSVEVRYSKKSLDQVIAALVEIRKTVPGDAKTYGWVDGYGDDEFHINFHYIREETDLEYLDRITKEGFERKRQADDEIVMYKRLKEKFEGTK